MTTLIRTVKELQAYRAGIKGKGSVALVPTMGALHEGHLSLIREARSRADHVIVSNFVNPLQFGPGEDYERYPRTLEADLELVGTLADAMFAPEASDMYPYPEPFQVDVGPIGRMLEGEIRPGHFNGVATVVLKLFLLAQPHVAIFGQKDAQQLAVIRRLVHDFNLGIEIVGVPIVREESGLARSSRNSYLSESGRADALALSGLLSQALKCPTAAEPLALLRTHEESSRVTWDYR
ncbi:pantoate--beta-alanine ligase, partial [Dermabacter hominis]|uniref:pantoate--beta-alanine ligase n=1 Tax=Dermabacter hominis TaxID=36740 RepID=UPI0031835A96